MITITGLMGVLVFGEPSSAAADAGNDELRQQRENAEASSRASPPAHRGLQGHVSGKIHSFSCLVWRYSRFSEGYKTALETIRSCEFGLKCLLNQSPQATGCHWIQTVEATAV
jgi:hypothetical protein